MGRKTKILILKLFYFSALAFFKAFVDECNCLDLKSRIIDGRPAKIGQFPWQVILKQSPYHGLRGGASLISADWVLTAAHCTFGLTRVYLKIGTNDLWKGSGTEMFSSEIYVHPEYNDTDMHNDISLIKLPMTLKVSDKIRPIDLVPLNYEHEDFDGNTAIVAGFGFIGDDFPNPFNDLLFGEVTIISNSKCEESYGEKVYSSTICSIAVDDSKQTICDGDSGGPLVIRDEEGHFFQIGIVSFSAKLSCNKSYPAAYARLTSYLDYVREITELELV